MAFVIFFSIAITFSLSLWAQSSSQVLTSNLVDDAFGQEINDSYKVPLISTVGDFNHTTGKLIAGHNPIEYNASNIPGLQIDDCPPQKEIAIYIHGFLVNGISLGSENATEIFDRARLSLNDTGYDITLIGFNWDSDIKDDKAWEVTKDVAKSNGLKLAQFILDFKKECPQTDVRLIAHSLGSRIALSSLDALNENQEWNNSICTSIRCSCR
jgi:esterase/lipase superfamily enzyme